MQKYFNKKCIFCGKTEAEFDKHNCWTEEHIIPKALGNETLRIFNVCKKCNSGLGTYVDNYFVNNMFIKIIRQSLGLKGQSGEIPNAFKEGEKMVIEFESTRIIILQGFRILSKMIIN